MSVKKVNAHFSDDILSTLLNEPIPGHGVFWSSAGGKSYPIPLRVLSFEQAYKARDPDYTMPRAKTFAEELRSKFSKALSDSRAAVPSDKPSTLSGATTTPSATLSLFDDSLDAEGGDNDSVDDPVDVKEIYAKAAFAKVAGDSAFMDRIKKGIPWAGVGKAIEAALPEVLEDRNKEAFRLVVRFLNETFGERDKAWETRQQPKRDGSGKTPWVYLK